MSETEKLEVCASAIHHLAERIRADGKVRHLLGFGTQSFQLLSEALAGLCGVSEEHAEDYMLGVRDEI